MITPWTIAFELRFASHSSSFLLTILRGVKAAIIVELADTMHQMRPTCNLVLKCSSIDLSLQYEIAFFGECLDIEST